MIQKYDKKIAELQNDKENESKLSRKKTKRRKKRYSMSWRIQEATRQAGISGNGIYTNRKQDQKEFFTSKSLLNHCQLLTKKL